MLTAQSIRHENLLTAVYDFTQYRGMKLLDSNAAAEELEITRQRLHMLLTEGRIVGAFRIGRAWAIPTPVKIKPGNKVGRPPTKASAKGK